MIKEEDPGCRVTCPLVLTADDLKLVKASGYDAIQVWVPPWGIASRTYEPGVYATAWSDGSWRGTDLPRDRKGFLERAVRLTGSAREAGLDVTAPLLMVSYLDTEMLLETCAAVVAAGATEIGLFDGPGAMAPAAMGHLVREAKANFPGTRVSIHPHNTFGLAVATALAAAQAGADVIEVSVNGYCGGLGNADLAAATAAFEALHGVRTGIVSTRLKALSDAATEMTGHPVAYNHPITGGRVYNWGGMDFMTQERQIDPLLHNCVDPAWSGSTVPVIVTGHSGPFTVWDKLTEIGVEPSRRLVDALTRALPAEIARLGRSLTDQEIHDIAVAAQARLAAGNQ